METVSYTHLFEFQLFDAVPFEETDVLPQMLVTEQKIYR